MDLKARKELRTPPTNVHGTQVLSLQSLADAGGFGALKGSAVRRGPKQASLALARRSSPNAYE